MSYTQYVKPMLLVIIPFLMGVGNLIKHLLFATNDEGEPLFSGELRKTFLKVIKTTKHVPFAIWILGVFFASIIGFVASSESGWRLILDSLVYCGLIQGSICAFVAMGVFDTFRDKK